MANAVDLKLVPRIRIDFKLVPVEGSDFYSAGTMVSMISFLVEVLVRPRDRWFTLPEHDISLEPSVSPAGWGWDRKPKIIDGDPGFLYIRNLTFILNDAAFHGQDWEAKLHQAKHFFLEKLANQILYHETLGHELKVVPFLKPSEDAPQMINLLKASPQETPTIVLKGLPCEWFADEPSMLNLRNFFGTLGRVRDLNLDMAENNVSIQFEDYEECCKALKKLCSFSLKMKKNNESRMVDYEVTLKNVFQEMLANNSILTGLSLKDDSVPMDKDVFTGKEMQALMIRMAMLEEELKGLKAIIAAAPAGYCH